MRLLNVSISMMLLLGLFFFNLGSVHATSGDIISNPDDQLVLINKSNQLPEDYVPDSLVTPEVAFSEEAEQLRSTAANALENMFADANQAGINLRAASGYRSYDYQLDLHQYYVNQYGEEYANQVSAKAGHSEHQTGLAMDVTSPANNNELTEEFASTEAGQWVSDHADEYGFIIRYPEGKESITGYNYEPWHLRYVGNDVAQHIMSNNLTLEEYHGDNGENNSDTTQTYTVQPGDTFWGIAQKYEATSVDDLRELNPTVDPYLLRIGMTINISGQPSNDEGTNDDGSNEDNTSEGNNETYVVQPGDTFWGIAQNYSDVTVNELMNANEGIEPRALGVNQTLTIPTAEDNNSGSDSSPESSPGIVTYTIKQGDTLWGIASDYQGVSINDLKEANPSIEPRFLSIGSQINIPR
ncbi:LysM peptidoglycan-binding domain-containing protein [Aquibacillus halophilus]|uniref:LysM peptidoglycan-binding domain-containing protein n=1 Tax=Aquibacillus halophilus TaxID=930132 RepID=A0A6A8DKR1_9BACI|nr:D-alanyl-D-alanine carboxypeptidase family protein [Aquibacillus halophilus]MRH44371.1 LysM peptidoglycan-binding domain-containing protein [Aquibacillus halophilus]